VLTTTGRLNVTSAVVVTSPALVLASSRTVHCIKPVPRGQASARPISPRQASRLPQVFDTPLAEFERELIVERTRAGLASAGARGRNGGRPFKRPFKMTPAKLRLAQAAMGQPGTKIGELCAELCVSRQTLYRYVDPTGVFRPDGKRLLGRSTRRPHQVLNPVQIGA